MNTRLIVILGLITTVLLFVLSGINVIPTKEEKVTAAWAQVENQYQRRMDLIPNLVATVKGAADFEKSTLTAVVEARAHATQITLTKEMLNDPEAMKKFEQAQGSVSSTLSRLMMVAEQYPDLKASQNFLALQSQLEGTENRISVARRDYIQAVQDYNTTIRTFPGVLWAKMYGATPKANFSAQAGAEKPTEVKF